MTDHTPGPWKVWDGPAYVGGGRDLFIGAGKQWLVNMDHRRTTCGLDHPLDDWDGDSCDICSVDGPEITAEQEANACLIAAAPDLLEALSTARTLIDDPDLVMDTREALDPIDKAIAKARGQEEG